jgi:hypothetical protein
MIKEALPLAPLNVLNKVTKNHGFYWSIEVYQGLEQTYLQSSCSLKRFKLPAVPILTAQELSPFFWSGYCCGFDQNRSTSEDKIIEGLSIVQQMDLKRLKLSVFCIENQSIFYFFCGRTLDLLDELSRQLIGYNPLSSQKTMPGDTSS